MGCFEDLMQFRDEVDGIKKRFPLKGKTTEFRCRKDWEKRKEDIIRPKVKG